MKDVRHADFPSAGRRMDPPGAGWRDDRPVGC